MLKKILQVFGFALIMAFTIVVVSLAGSKGPRMSASIQATARVIPAGGMTETESIKIPAAQIAASVEPGSHLFWLYCPGPSAVQVQIDRADGTTVSFENRMVEETGRDRMQWLTQYTYASLVEFEELPKEDGPLTITLIYTNN